MSYNRRYTSKRDSAFYLNKTYEIEFDRIFTGIVADGGYSSTTLSATSPVFDAGVANTVYTNADILLDGGSA